MDSHILRSLFTLASRAVPVDYSIKIVMNEEEEVSKTSSITHAKE